MLNFGVAESFLSQYLKWIVDTVGTITVKNFPTIRLKSFAE
jgi:hypothetical protein